MAGHRNDSRQMTELLQPDRVHQENAKSERRHSDRESSSQGASSPAFNSTSPSPSASSSSAFAALCFTSKGSNPPASPSYSKSTSSYTTATTSTFSAHRGDRRTSPTQPKWDEPLSNPREDCRGSCPLENLKRLPQCSGLEPLKCSATHTVLINVRACAFCTQSHSSGFRFLLTSQSSTSNQR